MNINEKALQLFDQGVKFHLEGINNKAIDYYLQSIKLNPHNADVYYNLGLVFNSQGRIEPAIDCFITTIQIRKDYRDAYRNLYVILNSASNPEFSIQSYKKLFQAVPNWELSGPIRVRIETSSACNLRCQHCPTGTNYQQLYREIMSMETFEKVLFHLKELPVLNSIVLYLAGEPLLNKNLATISRLIKQETMVTNIMLNTNGMLVTEELCKELADAGISQISVSIDGRSPEENNRIRKGSDYLAVVNNIKLLKKYLKNTEFLIANTIIKNEGDPPKPAIPYFLRKEFTDIPIDTRYAMKWPGLNTNNSEIGQLSYEFNESAKFCIMPFSEMSVRVNGDVVLCCYDLLGNTIMGNVFRESLLNIWIGKGYQNLRNNILNTKLDKLPEVCRDCSYYSGFDTLITKSLSSSNLQKN